MRKFHTGLYIYGQFITDKNFISLKYIKTGLLYDIVPTVSVIFNAIALSEVQDIDIVKAILLFLVFLKVKSVRAYISNVEVVCFKINVIIIY